MITINLSQTFYLARRPGLPWAPLRSRARSEAGDDPSQDQRRAVPKSATVVHTCNEWGR
ncbi:BQ5605_C003g02190 [Microbotryum silenes-dioicae]|uniref:BQ5605_C003g02190 protein n=1 Tax=Microbotryum silenes-dioicae TaxID=796604 RepID=A0A2X0P3K3_9BASI|nr:BQ5605_C003g02190 [Microbotryum silenes-dioicae]